jgi:arylsulfatase A-like enzyme/tetratricopeptide (TPR) repeat protein
VLVSVDTLRADYISSYGARESRTPGIDRIARGGVSFDDVTSSAVTTLPAHASLLTATSPLTHGVHDNVGFYLPRTGETLATYLKSRGYETGAFVGSFVLDRRFGLDRGFDVYDDDLGDAAEENDGSGHVAERRGDRVLARALDWMKDRSRGEPFFAFVHFYDAHAPYLPLEGFTSGTDDESRYRGEVAFVDSLVGKLLDWVEASHLEDETVIVLSADHGESLGEHGELTHGYFLYQSTLRIPFVLRYPGAPAGKRVPDPVAIVDVAPTLLDLLGLPAMPGAEGRSLLPAIDGRAAGAPAPTYSETYVPRLHYGFAALMSLRRGSKKFVLAPEPELYDLASDPGESRNLVNEDPATARAMREELEALIAAKGKQGSGSGAVSPAPLDTEARRRLESLGYGGGAGADGTSATREDPKDGLAVYLTVNDPLFDSVSPEDPVAFAAALRRLEEARRKAPRVPRIYLLLGDLMLKANRPADAEQAFTELASLDPESFSGSYGLGVARARQGKADAAIVALDRARALEPRNTKAYFELANVEAGRGKRAQAEDWLHRALEIRPDAALAMRLAELLVEEGKGGAAIQLMSELAKSHERDAGFAYGLGQVLLGEGQTDRALVELQRASSIDPDDPEILLALGNALAGKGRLEEAVSSYQRAVALSPSFAKAYSNLGSAYAELGRLPDAAAAFERAVSCDAGYAIAYKNLASVRLQLGDVQKAVAAMRSAVRASPGDEEMKRMLDELVAYQRSRH